VMTELLMITEAGQPHDIAKYCDRRSRLTAYF
jgi:hypothetical protein